MDATSQTPKPDSYRTRPPSPSKPSNSAAPVVFPPTRNPITSQPRLPRTSNSTYRHLSSSTRKDAVSWNMIPCCEMHNVTRNQVGRFNLLLRSITQRLARWAKHLLQGLNCPLCFLLLNKTEQSIEYHDQPNRDGIDRFTNDCRDDCRDKQIFQNDYSIAPTKN